MRQTPRERSALAMQLLQQSMQPREIQNPLQGWAQMAQALSANVDRRSADRDIETENKQQQEALAQALASLQSGDMQAAMGPLAQAGMGQEALALALQGQQQQQPIKLGADQVLLDPRTMQPIASNPRQGSNSYTLAPGAARYEDGKMVAENPKSPEDEATTLMKNLLAAGLQPGSPEYSAAMRRILEKPNTKVILNPEGKPLPPAVQENITGAADADRALDMMEENIGESGVVMGRVNQGLAKLGLNEKAIAFETGNKNMKLAAQSLIKGIPSNFDVQTVINTLPSLELPESVNRARIEFARKSLRNLVQSTISYYKGTGTKIPQHVLDMAAEFEVTPSKVKPWDGQGDPLMKASQEIETGAVKQMSDDEILKALTGG